MQLPTPQIQPADLGFFATLAASGSLTAAGRELGISTPAVSKRLAQIEARLGVALVMRTTRRMSMTPEGDLYLEHARRILGEIDELGQLLGSAKLTPKGLLRVNATLGFGRREIAPIVSKFVRRHPEVEVRLQLSVTPPLAADDAFDVCVRFGEPPDSRVVARRLAANQRILCAAPGYLARHAKPKVPRDLLVHNCTGIRQGDDTYGVWRFTSGRAPSAGRIGAGARQPGDERRRDRGQVGARGPRHRHAGAMGHRRAPAQRSPGAAAAEFQDAGRRHLRRLSRSGCSTRPGFARSSTSWPSRCRRGEPRRRSPNRPPCGAH